MRLCRNQWCLLDGEGGSFFYERDTSMLSSTNKIGWVLLWTSKPQHGVLPVYGIHWLLAAYMAFLEESICEGRLKEVSYPETQTSHCSYGEDVYETMRETLDMMFDPTPKLIILKTIAGAIPVISNSYHWPILYMQHTLRLLYQQ